MTDRRSEGAADAIARSQDCVRRFYESLRVLLAPHEPEATASVLAAQLKQVQGIAERIQWYPPHVLLHAIEANAAYYRGSDPEPLSESHYLAIRQSYVEFDDPYLFYLLEEERDLYLALLAMRAQQFYAQEEFGIYDLARTHRLLLKGDPLPRVSRAFQAQYNLSLAAWVWLSVGVMALVKPRLPPVFSPSQLKNSDLGLFAPDEVDSFLALTSLTSDALGAAYTHLRDEKPLHLHIFLRSSFVRRPILRMSGETCLVVHEPFLLANAWDGFLELARAWGDDLGRELGEVFEGYVVELAGEIPDGIRVFREAELREHHAGRVCDALIELPEGVVLVCPATIRAPHRRHLDLPT